MEIHKFMVPKDKLVTLRPEDTVQRAIEKMAHHNVSSVLVAEEDVIKGIVTSHDIMKIVSSRKSAGLSKSVEQIMSKKLISIRGTRSTKEAIQEMKKAEVHHLLVKDEHDVYVGIISSFDLIHETALDIHAHPWIRS